MSVSWLRTLVVDNVDRLVRAVGATGLLEAVAALAAVRRAGRTAARAEEPEQARCNAEQGCQPCDGQELCVDGLGDAELLDGGVQSADHDDGGCGREDGRGDHDGGAEARYEIGEAGADAGAETEDAHDDLQDGQEERDDVDDLRPARYGGVGVERVLDGAWEGGILAGGFDAGGGDVALDVVGVQGGDGPVVLGLAAPGVVVGGILVAVVEHVDLVAVLETDAVGSDVGVCDGADLSSDG